MGLTNSTTNNNKIVIIVDGKFSIRLPDGVDNEKAVERTLKKGVNAGKVVKELQYTGLEGKIKHLDFEESDWGSNFITVLEDSEGERFRLQMSVNSQFFGQYAKRMPNINEKEPIFFGIGFDKEKQRNFLFIKQNDVKVPMMHTKDNPNGMPPPETKTVQGKEVWDWTAQENFLYEVALEFSNFKESPIEEGEEIPF
tara:strand:- start:49 stop:639 length:591 start_codon:yes stop_codon:yes gene_type:complete